MAVPPAGGLSIDVLVLAPPKLALPIQLQESLARSVQAQPDQLHSDPQQVGDLFTPQLVQLEQNQDLSIVM
jgi:hypothetical protein